MQLKKALITGGNGFVGRKIVEQLLQAGVECRVVGRGSYPDLEKLGVETISCNICDEAAMRKVTSGVDIVFHVAALAGIWGPWKNYYNTNVLGTRSIIKACRGQVSSLVYTSTPSVVFDRNELKGEDESLPYPKSFLCNYAKSKVLAEQEMLAANDDELSTCAIRPHLVWGPNDPHLIPRLVAARENNKLKIVGSAENLVDISYIDNVAHAHLLAAYNLVGKKTAAGKAYFVSQGEPVNLWGWLNELFEMLNVAKLEKQISYKKAYYVGALLEGIYKIIPTKSEPPMTRFVAEQLAKSHYFSIKNAEKDLGYAPIVSTKEGMARFVAFFQS
ncbi:MAG: NAD-dependent epimerase/dehydratase family protein [Desulfotalea sp.]